MVRKRNSFNAGAWQVQRERFRLEKDAPAPAEHIVPMAEAVAEMMSKLGLDDRLWEQQLLSEWEVFVGPQVAKQTRPGRIQRGVLSIFVSHPTWLAELERSGKQHILKNLQERFGTEKIRSVRLQLDPDSGPR
jgi:predicted nucleic acid-binding Zn ribbon protein